jgi:hypothetical protein
MMHYWNLSWDWNTLESVRTIHSFLEALALAFFALLVLFDVLAHFAEGDRARSKKLERIGLVCFAVAVLAEILAYPYSRRNDSLSSLQDTNQRIKIASLETDAANAHKETETLRMQVKGYDKQIADDQARIKIAEATVATSKVAVSDAVAKVATAEARIAEAQHGAEEAKKESAALLVEEMKLEQLVKPRVIDKQGREDISKELHRFATALTGHKVSISSLSGDAEGYIFGSIISEMLTKAGIETEANSLGLLLAVGMPPFGLRVTGPTKNAEFITSFTLEVHRRLATKISACWDDSKYKEVAILVGARSDALPELTNGGPDACNPAAK